MGLLISWLSLQIMMNRKCREPDDRDEMVAGSRQIAALAQKLTLALQNLEVEAEIVLVPLQVMLPVICPKRLSAGVCWI